MSGSGFQGLARRPCHVIRRVWSHLPPLPCLNRKHGNRVRNPWQSPQGRHVGLLGDPSACEPVMAPAMMRQAVMGLAQN